MGKMNETLMSNGWLAQTYIKVFGGYRPSKIGRYLMSQLRLQLVQAAAGDVMNIQKSSEQQQDRQLGEWQLHFSNQLKDLFNRVGRISNYKARVDFLKSLRPMQPIIGAIRSRSRIKLIRKSKSY